MRVNSFPDPHRIRELLANLEPPPTLERELRSKFQRHHRVRRARNWMIFGAVAAACILAIILTLPAKRQQNSSEFFALAGMTITPEMLHTAHIVRVELTPEALARLGLIEHDGLVEAELLVTQDGLARGLRLADPTEEY